MQHVPGLHWDQRSVVQVEVEDEAQYAPIRSDVAAESESSRFDQLDKRLSLLARILPRLSIAR